MDEFQNENIEKGDGCDELVWNRHLNFWKESIEFIKEL